MTVPARGAPYGPQGAQVLATDAGNSRSLGPQVGPRDDSAGGRRAVWAARGAGVSHRRKQQQIPRAISRTSWWQCRRGATARKRWSRAETGMKWRQALWRY